MSGRRITTISLDDISYERSKQVGNLSAFVRDKLLDHANQRSNQPVDYHNAMHPNTGVCHPFKALDGYCSICWPYGQPTKQEYSDWIMAWYNSPIPKPSPPKQSPDRRKITHADAIAQEEGGETRPNRVGIIRQIWRFIF